MITQLTVLQIDKLIAKCSCTLPLFFPYLQRGNFFMQANRLANGIEMVWLA